MADHQAVVDATGPPLSLHDKNKLLELLKEFEELFDGTLGEWIKVPNHIIAGHIQFQK